MSSPKRSSSTSPVGPFAAILCQFLKGNEPGCLKNHLEELFTLYPCLKLLTGDAIYAQRPLLEAIQKHHRDYLVQIKENQGKTLEQMTLVFEDAPKQEPSDVQVDKKRGM